MLGRRGETPLVPPSIVCRLNLIGIVGRVLI